jgi:hypothetical protein
MKEDFVWEAKALRTTIYPMQKSAFSKFVLKIALVCFQ